MDVEGLMAFAPKMQHSLQTPRLGPSEVSAGCFSGNCTSGPRQNNTSSHSAPPDPVTWGKGRSDPHWAEANESLTLGTCSFESGTSAVNTTLPLQLKEDASGTKAAIQKSTAKLGASSIAQPGEAGSSNLTNPESIMHPSHSPGEARSNVHGQLGESAAVRQEKSSHKHFASEAKPVAANLPARRFGTVSIPAPVERSVVGHAILRRHMALGRAKYGIEPVSRSTVDDAGKIGREVVRKGSPGRQISASPCAEIGSELHEEHLQSEVDTTQVPAWRSQPVIHPAEASVHRTASHPTESHDAASEFVHRRAEELTLGRPFRTLSGDFASDLLERHQNSLLSRIPESSSFETQQDVVPVTRSSAELSAFSTKPTPMSDSLRGSHQSLDRGSLLTSSIQPKDGAILQAVIGGTLPARNLSPSIVQRQSASRSSAQPNLVKGLVSSSNGLPNVSEKEILRRLLTGPQDLTINASTGAKPSESETSVPMLGGVVEGSPLRTLHRSAQVSLSRLSRQAEFPPWKGMSSAGQTSFTHRSVNSPEQQAIRFAGSDTERVQRFGLPSVGSAVNGVGTQMPTLPLPQIAGSVTQKIPNPDLTQLANRIYDMLVRRLTSERQRRGI
jgi:hypothetical protein